MGERRIDGDESCGRPSLFFTSTMTGHHEKFVCWHQASSISHISDRERFVRGSHCCVGGGHQHLELAHSELHSSPMEAKASSS